MNTPPRAREARTNSLQQLMHEHDNRPRVTMKKSDDITKLAEALSKAQSQMKSAATSGENGHFKSVYSTLEDVVDAVRKPLTENGLSWVQLPDDTEGGMGVETVLMHESGQWISSLTVVPYQQKTAHGVGSALSYARRFGLAAICGVPPRSTEDDDGNVASTGERDPRAKLQEVCDLLRDATERDDKVGFWQVWSELKPQQVDFLHSQGTRYLSSKMKTFARTVEWEMNADKRKEAGIEVGKVDANDRHAMRKETA